MMLNMKRKNKEIGGGEMVSRIEVEGRKGKERKSRWEKIRKEGRRDEG